MNRQSWSVWWQVLQVSETEPAANRVLPTDVMLASAKQKVREKGEK